MYIHLRYTGELFGDYIFFKSALSSDFYMLKVTTAAAIAIGKSAWGLNSIRRGFNDSNHITAIKRGTHTGDYHIYNFARQSMANKYDCTFMTSDEVSAMGNFFDRHTNYLARRKDGARRGCHKGKPKGVSYVLCT
jgi:hypothetical protein